MRSCVAFGISLVFLISVTLPILSREKLRNYQTGKLLNFDAQEVTRGTAVIGGMLAPIPGKLYVFEIQLDNLVYFAEYKAGKLSYKPTWIVNDAIEFRLDKDNKMFLKRPDGKELEVVITKRVRKD